tara:strand:+ start:3018 stop:3494 length:477 start_codon:yes stop_codon:yes gene_type:complete
MIIGIDNGLSGGLVAISKHTGAVITKMVMPTLHRLKKREVDTRKVYEWVMSLESDFLVAIEEPLHHAKSSQAVRSMALSFGKLLGLAESRQWNVKCVSVHKWQKVMLGRVPKGKTKEVALMVADKLAPEECWLKSKRASKPHDGLIDAFLIARYIRGE